jgi:hypothetical protein
MTHPRRPPANPVIDSLMLALIGSLSLLGTFFLIIIICLATGLYTPCP